MHFVMFYQFVFYEASFPDTHEIATKLAVLDTIASLYGIIDASMCTKSDCQLYPELFKIIQT